MRRHPWGRLGLVSVVLAALMTAQQAPPILVTAAGAKAAGSRTGTRTGSGARARQARRAAHVHPSARYGPGAVHPGHPHRLGEACCCKTCPLVDFIDILAEAAEDQLHSRPAACKGTVTIYTYGEVKPVDHDAAARDHPARQRRRHGEGGRPVPHRAGQRASTSCRIQPTVNADPKTLPDDERMVLNLIFLKYATADGDATS